MIIFKFASKLFREHRAEFTSGLLALMPSIIGAFIFYIKMKFGKMLIMKMSLPHGKVEVLDLSSAEGFNEFGVVLYRDTGLKIMNLMGSSLIALALFLGCLVNLSVTARRLPRVFTHLKSSHFIKFKARRSNQTTVYIDEFYVTPGLRGHGLGTALLRSAIESIRCGSPGGRIFLLARDQRVSDFYQRHGFRPVMCSGHDERNLMVLNI